MDKLQRSLDAFEAILRAEHAEEIRSNLKAFRRAITDGIVRRFPMKKGRKRSNELDFVEGKRAQGWTMTKICALLYADYPEWGYYRRSQERQRLNAGLRARKKRRAALSPKETERENAPSVAAAETDLSCDPKEKDHHGRNDQQDATGTERGDD